MMSIISVQSSQLGAGRRRGSSPRAARQQAEAVGRRSGLRRSPSRRRRRRRPDRAARPGSAATRCSRPASNCGVGRAAPRAAARRTAPSRPAPDEAASLDAAASASASDFFRMLPMRLLAAASAGASGSAAKARTAASRFGDIAEALRAQCQHRVDFLRAVALLAQAAGKAVVDEGFEHSGAVGSRDRRHVRTPATGAISDRAPSRATSRLRSACGSRPAHGGAARTDPCRRSAAGRCRTCRPAFRACRPARRPRRRRCAAASSPAKRGL